jgi:rare lipoprotein A
MFVLVPALTLCQTQARATTIQGFAPEVQAQVWQEDTNEVASVSLNGKELLSFRSEAGSGAAAARAEELAAKLQEMLEDKKFDANDILPAKSGGHSTVQREGSTILSFDNSSNQSADGESAPLESSWKLVNAIRTAYNAPTLPSSYLKLVGEAEQSVASTGNCFSGTASWYGGKFHGRKTSDGHKYDQEKLTAAHRSLPFGTKLLVMNRKTGSTCVVEVNDRGPFVADRVIDLSRAAARQLNMLSTGVALVDCLVLGGQ